MEVRDTAGAEDRAKKVIRGKGEYIDTSMSDCLLHFDENILAGLLLTKSIAEKEEKAE